MKSLSATRIILLLTAQSSVGGSGTRAAPRLRGLQDESSPVEFLDALVDWEDDGLTYEDVKDEEEIFDLILQDNENAMSGSNGNRVLMGMDYMPSACNSEVESATCDGNLLSALVDAANAADAPTVVPCGQCYKVDIEDGSTVTLPHGLEVLGRLHFPPTSSVTINTTHVFVQGVWRMDPPNEGKKVKVTLYGTEEKTLYPATKCGGPGHEQEFDLNCMDGKNVGKKPFVVAGGKLDINAIDSACPSWTKLEDVVLLDPPLPPPECPQEGDSLEALNGTFESVDTTDGIHWHWGPATMTIESETDPATGQTNKYLHQADRANTYTGIQFRLNEPCLVAGRTYKFGFRYKVSGEEGTIVTPSINAWANIRYRKNPGDGFSYSAFKVCKDPTPANIWTTCETTMEIDETIAAGVDTLIAFHQGFDTTVDVSFDDVYFNLAPPDPVAGGLKVSPDLAECIRAGEEILITSYKYQGWNQEQVVKVESVDAVNGILTLTAGIEGDLPTKVGPSEEPRFAVEIARLERDVIFEAQADDTTLGGLHGGHLIVLHTPGVAQTISGVAFDNFGQQGNLGKYPIHFHMSGNVTGSIVSKNVVQRSNQRCIVIHGSHEVTVEDNVAYDTFGHCYILEDGGETGNTFMGNLGAKTKSQTHLIGASDNECSTFWITNPQNHYIGNVAAGSERSGIWFDTQRQVNGESGNLPGNKDVKPQNLNLGTFRDNVSHSNVRHGLMLYSPGWQPTSEAVLLNTVLYKQDQGVFWHNNKNTRLKGTLFADHRTAVRTFQNKENNFLEDSTIIGMSNDTRSRHDSKCQTNYYHGIRFAYNENEEGQPDLDNVGFSGFSDLDCDALAFAPYHADQLGTPTAGGIMHATGISFDSEENKMDIQCGMVPAHGYNNFYFEDFDGTIGESAVPGFLVQNEEHMTAFIKDSCSPVQRAGSCATWCENVCLRRARVEADPGDYFMAVTSSTDSTKYTFSRNEFANRFEAVLPFGQYSFHFEDNEGNQIFPSYTNLDFEKAPLCTDHITESSIEIIRAECPNEISIVDGTADSGTTQTLRGAWGGGTVSIASEYGNNFFTHRGSSLAYGGVRMDIDQECAVSGETYGLYLKYRTNTEVEIKPKGMMHYKNAAGQWRGTWFFYCTRYAQAGKGWVECYGTATLTDEMIASPMLWAWLSWQGSVIPDADYDDISFAKHTSWPTPTCPANGGEMISDGTADSGSLDGIDGRWGSGKISVQTDSDDITNKVFSITGRTAYHNGVNIYLDTCLTSGLAYTFSFRHRLHGAGPNGEGDSFHGLISWTSPSGVVGRKYFLNCPPSANSEWAQCSSSVTITDDMASAVKVQLAFWSRASWNQFDYDFDDLSFLPTA